MLDKKTYNARLQDVYERAWRDPVFSRELQTDPHKALAAYFEGISVDCEVRVVQDSMDTKYLHIPAAPAQGEIDERDLVQVQGGTTPVCFGYIVTTVAMAVGVTVYSTIEGC
ncbi:hypothetical protein [Ruegeria jejuensis]|uniref:hypothetical protein n=1 Tax=Ruegeria jejuensis TaxID=3233338 RepID=UPI00355C1788